MTIFTSPFKCKKCMYQFLTLDMTVFGSIPHSGIADVSSPIQQEPKTLDLTVLGSKLRSVFVDGCFPIQQEPKTLEMTASGSSPRSVSADGCPRI